MSRFSHFATVDKLTEFIPVEELESVNRCSHISAVMSNMVVSLAFQIKPTTYS